MKNSIDEKLSRGKWIAVYPYGYCLDILNGEHVVSVDPYKSSIVKELFELYASEQYSLSMLEEHIKNKYKEPLYKAKIENILKKKFYYGVMEVKGREYAHTYGLIVTKSLYDKVQSIMRNRRGRWKPKLKMD